MKKLVIWLTLLAMLLAGYGNVYAYTDGVWTVYELTLNP